LQSDNENSHGDLLSFDSNIDESEFNVSKNITNIITKTSQLDKQKDNKGKVTPSRFLFRHSFMSEMLDAEIINDVKIP